MKVKEVMSEINEARILKKLFDQMSAEQEDPSEKDIFDGASRMMNQYASFLMELPVGGTKWAKQSGNLAHQCHTGTG